MLVCISSFHSGSTGIYTSGIFPLSGANTNVSPRTRLHYWDFSHSEARLCCRNFSLSESQVHSSADESNTHSETYVNPTPMLEFPPHGGQKFAGTADGNTPFWEQHKAYQTIHMPNKHPGVKDQHSEETWSIRTKPTIKQSRKDLNKYFYSKDTYIRFTQKSLSTLNTYLITSNKSNTKLHYSSVFTLF